MISLEEARTSQDQLQEQGRRLLESFDLPGILAPLGEFGLQGSFVYGLMIKPDIDCRVYAVDPDINKVADVARSIMVMPSVVRTLVTNFTHYSPGSGQPKGIYLGIKVDFEETLWNFDTWIIKQEDELGEEFFDLATSKYHDKILILKYQLKARGLYPGSSKIPGSFSSADLYRAVARDGILNVDELMEWRQKSN